MYMKSKWIICTFLCATVLLTSCTARQETAPDTQSEPLASEQEGTTQIPTEGTTAADTAKETETPAATPTTQAGTTRAGSAQKPNQTTTKPSTQKPAATTAPKATQKPKPTSPSTTKKPTTTKKPSTTSANPNAGGSLELGVEAQMLRRVNEERAANGKRALQLSEELNGYARIRAKEIAQPGHFSHTRPDGSSGLKIIPSFSSAGENIAYGQRNVDAVMQSWMNSSGHRANILNGSFTQLGVGCYKAPNGTLYWVQLFKG